MNDRKLEKAKYVSRDLDYEGSSDFVELHKVLPEWNAIDKWWSCDHAIGVVSTMYVSQFREWYGWCPKPGECWEVEWGEL